MVRRSLLAESVRALATVAMLCPAGAAQGQSGSPLSAIDWLRQTGTAPQPGAYPVTPRSTG